MPHNDDKTTEYPWLLNLDSNDEMLCCYIEKFRHLAMGHGDHNLSNVGSVDWMIDKGRLAGAALVFAPIELGDSELEKLLGEANRHGTANRCIITYSAADRDKERAEQWAAKFGSIALHKNMGTEPAAEKFFKAAGERRLQAALEGGKGCTV